MEIPIEDIKEFQNEEFIGSGKSEIEWVQIELIELIESHLLPFVYNQIY